MNQLELFPETLRSRAIELAVYACDGVSGRSIGDPVFDEVTEGRARWAKYSACGDLAHWLLDRLGIRANRNDDGDDEPWEMGHNLSAIVYSMPGAFVWAAEGKLPKAGDILYVAHPEHVCVLLADNGVEIVTADYGQWDPRKNKPCGRVNMRKGDLKSRIIGSRRLRGWLDIELAVAAYPKAVHPAE